MFSRKKKLQKQSPQKNILNDKCLIISDNEEILNSLIQSLENFNIKYESCFNVKFAKSIFDNHSLVITEFTKNHRLERKFVLWLQKISPNIKNIATYYENKINPKKIDNSIFDAVIPFPFKQKEIQKLDSFIKSTLPKDHLSNDDKTKKIIKKKDTDKLSEAEQLNFANIDQKKYQSPSLEKIIHKSSNTQKPISLSPKIIIDNKKNTPQKEKTKLQKKPSEHTYTPPEIKKNNQEIDEENYQETNLENQKNNKNKNKLFSPDHLDFLLPNLQNKKTNERTPEKNKFAKKIPFTKSGTEAKPNLIKKKNLINNSKPSSKLQKENKKDSQNIYISEEAFPTPNESKILKDESNQNKSQNQGNKQKSSKNNDPAIDETNNETNNDSNNSQDEKTKLLHTSNKENLEKKYPDIVENVNHHSPNEIEKTITKNKKIEEITNSINNDKKNTLNKIKDGEVKEDEVKGDENDDLISLFLKENPNPIALLNNQFCYIGYNQLFIDHFQLNNNTDYVGKNVFTVNNFKNKTKWEEKLKEGLNGKKTTISFTDNQNKKTNTWKILPWINLSNNSTEGIILSANLITQNKTPHSKENYLDQANINTTEKENTNEKTKFKLSEAITSALFSQDSSIPITILDLSGKIQIENDSAVKIQKEIHPDTNVNINPNDHSLKFWEAFFPTKYQKTIKNYFIENIKKTINTKKFTFKNINPKLFPNIYKDTIKPELYQWQLVPLSGPKKIFTYIIATASKINKTKHHEIAEQIQKNNLPELASSIGPQNLNKFIQNTINQITLPTWITDPKANITFLNNSFINKFYAPNNNTPKKTEEYTQFWNQVIHQDDKAQFSIKILNALTNKKNLNTSLKLLNNKNKYKNYEIKANYIKIPNNNSFFIGTCSPIPKNTQNHNKIETLRLENKLKNIEIENEETEKKFAQLQKKYLSILDEKNKPNLDEKNPNINVFDHINIGIIILNKDATIYHKNKFIDNLFESSFKIHNSLENIISHNSPNEKLASKQKEKFIKNIWQRQKKATFTLNTQENIKKTFEFIPKLNQNALLFIIVNDISSFVTNENLLIKFKKKFDTLFKNYAQASLITNHNGRILDANPSACKLLKSRNHQICNQQIETIIDTSFLTSHQKIINELSENKQNTKTTEIKLNYKEYNSKHQLTISKIQYKNPHDSIYIYSIQKNDTKQSQNLTENKNHLNILNFFNQNTLIFVNKNLVIQNSIIPKKKTNQVFDKITPNSDLKNLLPQIYQKVETIINSKNFEELNEKISLIITPSKKQNEKIYFTAQIKKIEENLYAIAIKNENQKHKYQIIQKQFDFIFENSKLAIIITNLKGQIIKYNKPAKNLLQSKENNSTDLKNKSIVALLNNEKPEQLSARISRDINNKKIWQEKLEIINDDKEKITINSHFIQINSQFESILIGINEKINPNEDNHRNINQFKQIQTFNHRVKNDLQILISLINHKIDDLTDPNAIQILKISQSRIHALALFYQNLSLKKNLTVNLKNYINALKNYFSHSYQDFNNPANNIKNNDYKNTITKKYISFSSNIDESIQAPSSIAIPLALISNEAIINSISHAFKKQKSGEIHISLTANKISKTIHYSISDNGSGFNPNTQNDQKKSNIGLSIIFSLTKQLKAQLNITNHSNKDYSNRTNLYNFTNIKNLEKLQNNQKNNQKGTEISIKIPNCNWIS